MTDLRALIPAHREIADRIRALFPEETDETALADTIEGESDLPAAIIAALRAAVEREVTAKALADLIDTMTARKRRFDDGARSLRLAALRAMEEVGLKRLAAPDFSVSVGTGKPRLVITDESAIPDSMCRIKREPDKVAIMEAIKAGLSPSWASLSNATPILTIHRK